MFCQKCGTELPDGALFCAKCGTNQASFLKTNTEVTKKIETKYLGMAGITVVLVIVICIIANNTGKKVDLNDYYTVTFEGYDTKGKAKGEFDEDAFYTKYRKVLRKHKVSKKDAADVVDDLYEAKIDKVADLSNGDEVKVEWEINEEKFTKKLGLKSKTKEKIYTVEGLKGIKTFDAFKGIELEFTGMAPNGSANVTGNIGENGLRYNVVENGTLSNGDKVKVVASFARGTEDIYLEENGCIPEKMSKEYTVEGLDEYLSKYEDIPADIIEKMKKEAEDVIIAYTTNYYNGDTNMNGLEYAGYIFKGTKPAVSYFLSSVNGIYLVYKGTVYSESGMMEPTTVYYPVWFSTLVKKNGEVSYESCEGIKGSSNMGNNGNRTNGYLNPMLLYIERYAESGEEYYMQCGDGMEVYSDYVKVQNMASINTDKLSELEAKALDCVQVYCDDEFAKQENNTIENLMLVGEYLLIAKEQDDDLQNNNFLYVVVGGTATNTEGIYEPKTVYFPVRFDKLSEDAKGELYYEHFDGMMRVSEFISGMITVQGFVDGTSMYNEIISSNRDKYSYEVTEELRIFGD